MSDYKSLKEQYDALIVYSQHDYDIDLAKKLKTFIEKCVPPLRDGKRAKVCVFSTGDMLEFSDKFDQFEEASKRSTYIFFLVTPQFIRSRECNLKKNAVLQQMIDDKDRNQCLRPMYISIDSISDRDKPMFLSQLTPMFLDNFMRPPKRFSDLDLSSPKLHLQLDNDEVEKLVLLFSARLHLKIKRSFDPQLVHQEALESPQMESAEGLNDMEQKSTTCISHPTDEEPTKTAYQSFALAHDHVANTICQPFASMTNMTHTHLELSRNSENLSLYAAFSKDTDTMYKSLPKALLPPSPKWDISEETLVKYVEPPFQQVAEPRESQRDKDPNMACSLGSVELPQAEVGTFNQYVRSSSLEGGHSSGYKGKLKGNQVAIKKIKDYQHQSQKVLFRFYSEKHELELDAPLQEIDMDTFKYQVANKLIERKLVRNRRAQNTKSNTAELGSFVASQLRFIYITYIGKHEPIETIEAIRYLQDRRGILECHLNTSQD